MNLLSSKSEIFPTTLQDSNLRLTTHLGIGAHPDDVEIGLYSGIGTCYKHGTNKVTGVVITDGATDNKTSIQGMTPEKKAQARILELQQAASVGGYLALITLGYTSDEIKRTMQSDIRNDITSVLEATRPEIVYLHSLFDDHDTHLAASRLSLEALRELSNVFVPQKVYGCEVTESLDWDPQKIRLDTSMYPEVAEQVLYAFISQADALRNYPNAALERWGANAVFDRGNKQGPRKISFAMDLTRLVTDGTNLEDFIGEKVQEFMLRKKNNLRSTYPADKI